MIEDIKDRLAVVEHAWRLAMTGQYADWGAVAHRLEELGYSTPAMAMHDARLRREMNRVCGEAAEDAAELARIPIPDGPSQRSGESDEAAVWRTIEEEHRAYWTRDYEREAAYHVQAPNEMLWSWSAASGVSIWHNWDELRAGMRLGIESSPEPNPFVTLRVRRRNKSIRIRGDVAWVTFEEAYPTDNLPAFRGASGCIHELRILERDNGVWRIAFLAILDEQAGQTATPVWEVDRSGRVLWQNAAALAYPGPQTEMYLRAGRVQMRHPETNRRLQAALAVTAQAPECLMFGRDETPVVFDPGDGQPVRVWWVRARSGKLFVSVNDAALVGERLSVAANALRLTPAQERLIFAIASGLTLETAAEREGVRLSTARTQLQRTYDKVGVRSQAALMHALLAASP